MLMIVSMLRKPGNICCGHRMFLKEIRNNFVSRTQILCPQQMLRARANGETFLSATMAVFILETRYPSGRAWANIL